MFLRLISGGHKGQNSTGTRCRGFLALESRGRGGTYTTTSRFQDQKATTSKFQDQKATTSRFKDQKATTSRFQDQKTTTWRFQDQKAMTPRFQTQPNPKVSSFIQDQKAMTPRKNHDIEIPIPKNHDIEKRRQISHDIVIPRHFFRGQKATTWRFQD